MQGVIFKKKIIVLASTGVMSSQGTLEVLKPRNILNA